MIGPRKGSIWTVKKVIREPVISKIGLTYYGPWLFLCGWSPPGDLFHHSNFIPIGDGDNIDISVFDQFKGKVDDPDLEAKPVVPRERVPDQVEGFHRIWTTG